MESVSSEPRVQPTADSFGSAVAFESMLMHRYGNEGLQAMVQRDDGHLKVVRYKLSQRS